MATYGIEVLTGLSETRLDGKSKTIRTVKWVLLDGNSSGSMSIPEYDSTKGVMTLHPVGGFNTVYKSTGEVTVDWDNSSKTLSWTNEAADESDSHGILVSLVHYE